jgi:hypothetical protein
VRSCTGAVVTVWPSHLHHRAVDAGERKVYSAIRVTNQDDQLCLVATHVLKLIDVEDGA